MMTPDEELKEDDIVVEIEAEAEADVSAAVANEGEKPKTEDAVEVIKAQTEEYEANLERERQAKKEAEERAAKAEREAAVAKDRVVSSEIETVEAALAIAETKKVECQRLMKKAMEEGDFDAFIKHQTEFNDAHYASRQLNEGKRALESRASAPATSDPVEGYISRFSQRSQDYLRKNIEYVKDPVKNKKLVAAHYEAEAEGYTPDTDAYFEYLDSRLKGAAQPAKVEKESHPSRKSTPAAPVSRGNDLSSGGSGGERKVKLTPNEARAATDGTIVWNTGPNKGKPIGVKEYARRKTLMADNNSDLAS
jgi:hypothetical protein